LKQAPQSSMKNPKMFRPQSKRTLLNMFTKYEIWHEFGFIWLVRAQINKIGKRHVLGSVLNPFERTSIRIVMKNGAPNTEQPSIFIVSGSSFKCLQSRHLSNNLEPTPRRHQLLPQHVKVMAAAGPSHRCSGHPLQKRHYCRREMVLD